MTPALRPATPDDAAMLAALARRTFSETFGHLYSAENLAAFLAGHSEARWREELADPRFSVMLAETPEQAAGYAKLGPPSLPSTPSGRPIELRQFYVLAPWHGTGLATRMMTWVLDTARRRGADELYLSVFIDNVRARRFYARYGFERVGSYAFMVGSHADEDDVMRLAL